MSKKHPSLSLSDCDDPSEFRFEVLSTPTVRKHLVASADARVRDGLPIVSAICYEYWLRNTRYVELDELLCIGSALLTQAVADHDPSEGSFTKHLAQQIHWALLSEVCRRRTVAINARRDEKRAGGEPGSPATGGMTALPVRLSS